MSYQRKLQNPKWQRKRLLIMQRDKFRCVYCDSDEKELQVHHERYIPDREPWEYPDELLITLCHACHEKKHKPEPKTLSENPEVVSLSVAVTDFIVEFYNDKISNDELLGCINNIQEPKLTVLNAFHLALKSDKLREFSRQDAGFYIRKFVQLNEVKKEFVKTNKITAVVTAY